MIKSFWDYTDDELLTALDLIHDTALQEQSPPHPMIDFVYDNKLQKMLILWSECEHDRNLLKLKYADEIEAIQDYRTVPWFNSSTLSVFELNHDYNNVG